MTTNLSVIPSKHFVPTRQDFEQLLDFKAWSELETASKRSLYLDKIPDEMFMHYRYALADIPALLLKFLDGDQSNATFRDGVAAVDRDLYVCSYGKMM
jgi:hypothetical protein